MEFTLELVKNDLNFSPHELEARDYFQNGSIKFFGSGQVAMMPMGEWTAWQLLERDDIDFEWAVTEMPYPQGGRRNVTIGNVTIASILSHSSSKEMAYEFIKTLSGPSGAKIYASNKSIPAFINEEIRSLSINNIDTFRQDFVWSRATLPLLNMCLNQDHAPDLTSGLQPVPRHFVKETWLRGKIRGLFIIYRAGGFRAVFSRFSSGGTK